MFVLRLVFILSALAISLSLVVYFLTNERRHLDNAKKIARFVLYAALIFAVLYIVERYVLIGWRMLF